jgi:hypothetical protein
LIVKRRTFVGWSARIAGGFAALPLLPGCGGGSDDPTREQPAEANRSASGQMASTRTYAAAAGATIYGGRFGNTLLELLRAAPPDSWIKANTNTFMSIWAPDDLKAGLAGPGTPTAVIRCWSSFAWDSVRSRLILYGGGHGNYEGNEVYVFDGNTRQWSLGFHTSDVVEYEEASYITVDGPLHSPISAHTYDNNGYLQMLDRFITFGGAAAHSGGGYVVVGDGPQRLSGPYTLDLSLAGQGMVGGLTGSNVKRGTMAGVNLPGAQAWSLRDYFKDHPLGAAALFSTREHKSCGSVYRVEGGKDVVYKLTYYNSALWRYQFNDADYRNDTILQIGVSDLSTTQWDSTCALDTDNDVFLALGEKPNDVLHGYDLKLYGGTPITNFRVPSAGLTGSGATEFLAEPASKLFGIDYDQLNHRFCVWSEGGKVYSIQHGGGVLTGNWVVAKISDGTAPVGSRPKTRAELDAESLGIYTKSDTGTNGKWKWASELNAFVALQHCYHGNVWIYKPGGWAPPMTAAVQDARTRAAATATFVNR